MLTSPEEATRLTARTAAEGTVHATFTTAETIHFTLNWAKHLRAAGVRGVLVGIMNAPAARIFERASTRLRALGAAVYACASSRESKAQPQGGRWFHLLPLLAAGVRIVLSDSDVVWLRHPLPYFRALEAAHPLLDFSISTDAQGSSRPKLLAGTSDLDAEVWTHCWESMNLGSKHRWDANLQSRPECTLHPSFVTCVPLCR